MLPRKTFLKQLRRCLEALDPEALVAAAPAEVRDRNDAHIPAELLQRAYVYNTLDVEGLRAALLAHPDLGEAGDAETDANR